MELFLELFLELVGFIIEVIKKPKISVEKIEFVGEKETCDQYKLKIKNISKKNIYNFYIINCQHPEMTLSLKKNQSITLYIELPKGKISEILGTYVMAKYSCIFKIGKKTIIKNYVQDIILQGKGKIILFEVRDTKKYYE